MDLGAKGRAKAFGIVGPVERWGQGGGGNEESGREVNRPGGDGAGEASPTDLVDADHPDGSSGGAGAVEFEEVGGRVGFQGAVGVAGRARARASPAVLKCILA